MTKFYNDKLVYIYNKIDHIGNRFILDFVIKDEDGLEVRYSSFNSLIEAQEELKALQAILKAN